MPKNSVYTLCQKDFAHTAYSILAALAVRTIALLHIVNESEQYYITREVTEIE